MRRTLTAAFSLAGLLLLVGFLAQQPNIKDVTGPPTLTQSISQAPTVPLCELIRDFDTYDKGIVRTQAMLFTNMENTYLFDPACRDGNTAVWAEFDPSYVYTDDALKERLDQLLCPESPCPTGTAQVTVVGRFDGPADGPYGHLSSYRFRFSLIRLEQAETSVNASNEAKNGQTFSASRRVYKPELQFQQEIIRDALKRATVKLHLDDLHNIQLGPTESETRIWVGFGLLSPRCFVFKNVNGVNQALFFTVQRSRANAYALTPPQSGWLTLEQILKSSGIRPPLQLKPDYQHLPDPDEELIVVELKSGAEYYLIYYPVATDTQDGKRVVELCRTIEEEFDVRMGCGAL